ncbi:MAG TPA: hypothetical protein VIJ92_14650 [Ginsengibacter sp.]
MNFQTMNKQRKFVLIAAGVGIISMFLPWISASSPFGYGPSYSENGFQGIGILAFLCFTACGVIACLGDQTKNLDKNMWVSTLTGGALALFGVGMFYLNYTRLPFGGPSLTGFGLYIAVIAAIGILASAYMFRAPTDNLKDSFNTLKKDIENKINSTANTTTPGDKTSNPGNTNPPA